MLTECECTRNGVKSHFLQGRSFLQSVADPEHTYQYPRTTNVVRTTPAHFPGSVFARGTGFVRTPRCLNTPLLRSAKRARGRLATPLVPWRSPPRSLFEAPSSVKYVEPRRHGRTADSTSWPTRSDTNSTGTSNTDQGLVTLADARKPAARLGAAPREWNSPVQR